MKNNKFFLAVIAGAVVSFLLGYIIYGILLKDIMVANCGIAKEVAEKVFKPMDKPDMAVLGTIFIANIIGALVYTIIAAWANARSFASGLKVGATTALLFSLNVNLMWLATSYITTPMGIAMDCAATTVMMAITTGVIGMILGKGATTS
jgi:hypothetical protein